MTQESLFDTKPYQKNLIHRPAASARPPVSGIDWRRTALRRDCDGCMRQQHDEYVAGEPLTIVRRRAVAQFRTWDDEGQLSHDGYYCKKHAELMGWDSSRSRDPRKRGSVERQAKIDLADAFTDLKKLKGQSLQSRAGSLIIRAGGGSLDAPEWSIHHGILWGQFMSRVEQSVRDWADHWGADVDREHTIGQDRLTVVCRVVDVPLVRVAVGGYVEAA